MWTNLQFLADLFTLTEEVLKKSLTENFIFVQWSVCRFLGFFVSVFVIFLDVILNRGYRISHSFRLPHSSSRQNNFQNSLFPNPSTTSRSINNSLGVYHFLDSEPELGKLKEFNSQKVKVPVNRAFKSYSFLP